MDIGFDHSTCRFQVGQRVKFAKGHGFLHPYFDLGSESGNVVQIIPTPGGWVYNVRLDKPRCNGFLINEVVQCMGDEIEQAGA